MPTTYVKIATVTVGSGGAADITFSSIPATYTDLKIVYSLRCTTDLVNTTMTFNGSSSNFGFIQLYGTGTTLASNVSGTNANLGPVMSTSTNTAQVFSNGEVYISNYLSSTNKTLSIESVNETNNTTAYQQFLGALWSNTGSVTSIALTPASAGNFAQYSTATLYGIKSS